MARIKVNATLNATELLAVPAPQGKPRVSLRVGLPGAALTADIATRTLRKAQEAIRKSGLSNVTVVLQGHLAAGDRILEAGLGVQAAKSRQAR